LKDFKRLKFYVDAEHKLKLLQQRVSRKHKGSNNALSDFLAQTFFMGDKPTTLDATAYAYIGNLIKPPYSSSIVDYVLQLENLCQHYE
jgi:hypothetical protein